jgi:Leucine-rich repeat (LRR) protein
MRKFILIISLLMLCSAVFAQTDNSAQIRQKMADIRKNTNWDNPDEVKKANDEIKKLSKQLMMQGNTAPGQTEEEKEESVDDKMKLINQMFESVRGGEGADILLATPFREDIIEKYRDDESPEIKSPEYLNEMTLLCIDMSLPTVQRTIDQMEKFKSIKTLVITGGKYGRPVNLEDLLRRAANYPLEALYIINFRDFVTAVPVRINKFSNLSTLSLTNNNIKKLPGELSTLKNLKTLYIDMNPVETILNLIIDFSLLETLGIAKTGIPQHEIVSIKQSLPNCNILQQ